VTAPMEILEALEHLDKVMGRGVEYEPVRLPDGRKFYHVDGVPRSEEQILRWVIDGLPPGD